MFYVSFVLSNYKGKGKIYIRYKTLQIRLTTGIKKSTRKSVTLLTILVAFCSHFMKVDMHLFIYTSTKIYVICKIHSFNTYSSILLQSPNYYVKICGLCKTPSLMTVQLPFIKRSRQCHLVFRGSDLCLFL